MADSDREIVRELDQARKAMRSSLLADVQQARHDLQPRVIAASYWGPIVATLVVVALFAAAALGAALYARNTARKLKFEEDAGHG